MGKMEFKPDKNGKMIAYKDGKEVGWVQVYGTGSQEDETGPGTDKSTKKKQRNKDERC